MFEFFIGVFLVDLVVYEVGYIFGFCYNFKVLSVYFFVEMNSDVLKGNKLFVGLVMDYLLVNFYLEMGEW